MKLIFLITTIFSGITLSFGQDDFIRIEANRTLGIFNFLETSVGKPGTSRSYQDYIFSSYETDKEFIALVHAYASLNLNYSINREEYPEKRRSGRALKDLLWIASSNASSIDDFSQRIIGYLPHQTQTQFIQLMKKSAVYYDDLVWNKTQVNTKRIIDQLSAYKEQIGDLYLKIGHFYNTTWSREVPFKIVLYPIPLKRAGTTAIPKGNALICGFLAEDENDYKARLGVIIHEMCHILYKEQTPEFQHKIDTWFTESTSPYAPLAYSFINEGLATVLGNGWAFKEIHGKLDPSDWYNNKHIDGFAHALLPLTTRYLEEEKSIDQNFVSQTIELFGETFPKAPYETAILMNGLQIFANTEKDKEIDQIAGTIHDYFNIRSMWLSTPILSEDAKETFNRKTTTKVFIVESDNENTLKGLAKAFPKLDIKTPLNTIDIFNDKNSMSTIIVMNLEDLSRLEAAYKTLAGVTYLENGASYEIE